MRAVVGRIDQAAASARRSSRRERRATHRFGALLVVSAALGGCEDGAGATATRDDGGRADASGDSGTVDGDRSFFVEPPAPPTAPAPPAPCGDGFAERDGHGCAPYGGVALDPTTCATDAILHPTLRACEPLAPCPADDYAATTASTVLHVRAGALGGDGSRERPFGRIGEATAVASTGATVLVAKGSYGEVVVVPNGVALVGACARETIVGQSLGAPVEAVVRVSGGAIEGLTLIGSGVGLFASGAGTTTVRDVIVTGVAAEGVRAERGATVELDRVKIDRPASTGVFAHDATVIGRRVSIVGAGPSGVWSEGTTSRLALEDATVDATRFTADPAGQRYGVGIVKVDGDVTLRRVAITRSVVRGLSVGGYGPTVELEDVTVDGVETAETGFTNGQGIVLYGQAKATLRRVTVANTGAHGIHLEGGRLSGHDLRAHATGLGGIHSVIATVALTRARFTEFGDVATYCNGGSCSFTDVITAHARPSTEYAFFSACHVVDSAKYELQRAQAEDCGEVAIAGNGTLDAMMLPWTFADVSIRRCAAGINLDGLDAPEQPATLSRVHIEDTASYGLVTQGNVHQVVEDFAFVGADAELGRGTAGIIVVGSRLTGRRIAIERARPYGLVSSRPGGSVTASDVHVATTGADGVCGTNAQPCGASGTGLLVFDAATASLDRFVIEDGALAGIVTFEPIQLADGLVRRNPIGMHVASDALTVEQYSSPSVRYVDNERPLDVRRIPIPEIDVPTTSELLAP